MISRHFSSVSALATLPLALALAGCAGGKPSTYPSLAPRPIEQLSLAEPSRPAPPAPVASTEATARFAPQIAKAQDADARFRKTMGEERPALEKGRSAAVGTEAWTDAQEALTRVETARGALARILSDLDAARNAPDTETDTGAAIAAAQAYDQVAQIDEQENAALQALRPSAN
jgi:hypothetical protein